MKYRIKIYSSFCSCDRAKSAIEELLTSNISFYGEGVQDNVFIVGGTDTDFTHIIIWNTAMPSIPDNIPKENVIGLAYEPATLLRNEFSNGFISYAQANIHRYYIGDATGLPSPFVSGNSYLTYSPPRPNHCLLKHTCMSVILSEKNFLQGHDYRHSLVKCILNNKLPIDIFGRGTRVGEYRGPRCSSPLLSDRIKGPFDKYEPYDGYLFHICIENVVSDDYFSEKVINPLLCNTTPVYLGAKNIHSYFPNNIISLTGNLAADMTMLVDILQNPLAYYRSIDVTSVERSVSLVNNVASLFGK